MNRNTVILRLVVLAGAVVVGLVLLTGLLTPRHGGGPGGEGGVEDARLLPETTLRQRLAESGREVESLERQGGLVLVRLQDGGELWLDGVSGREIELPERRGQGLAPGQVRLLLQAEGYSEIRGLNWRRGAYEAEAEDAEGRRWRLRLDTYSGALLEREAL